LNWSTGATTYWQYRGEGPKMNPKGAFGMSPDEIGMRTLEFATQVAKGWKPKATEPRPPR
jgi:hypothetical protein